MPLFKHEIGSELCFRISYLRTQVSLTPNPYLKQAAKFQIKEFMC